MTTIGAQFMCQDFEECIASLKDDFTRAMSVDIETNSTIDAEATEDKESVAEYMQAFHAAYGRSAPAVMALHDAQAALLRSGRYHHPFYWSGFVLTGAAR